MTASTFDASPFGRIAAGIVGNSLDRKTKALLGRGDSPRSGQPVWRNSYTVGQIENRIWKPIHDGTARGGKRWTRALLKRAKELEAASRLKRREKTPGTENGLLGSVGLEVLEFLYDLVDYRTGTLEPAISTIAEGIGRSYSAVHRALVRLRDCGFLGWMRRSSPIEEPAAGGPNVKQETNAYALLVPREFRSWMARLLGKAPIPACEQDRKAQDKAEIERMTEHMTCEERHRETWHGAALLGDTLAGLARAIDARSLQSGESSRDGETGGSY